MHANHICKKVKDDGIKVMLSGIGADELFFGYTGMINTLRISIISKLFYPYLKYFSETSLVENEFGAVITQNKGSRKSKLYKVRSNYFKDLLLKNELKDKIFDYNSIELKYWGSILPNEDYIDESSYLGLILENAASVAISGDIPAMMNGVEVRCPFLDSEIINFAFNCKWDKKINLFSNSQNLKKILRDAVSDIIPENLLNAPKRGFGFGITEKNLLQGPWEMSC